MKDFLEFINTTSPEDLTKSPDIDQSLAEKIIAARPYGTLDEVKKIEGLTAKKLSAIHLTFDVIASPKESATASTVSEDSTDTRSIGKKTSIGKIIFSVIVALLILGALFAAVYFGIPWFKEKVLTPLQNNTELVSQVASQQTANMDSLSAEITLLQDRVSTLEARADTIDQSIQAHSEALSQLDTLQAALQANIDTHKVEMTSLVAEQLTLTRAIEFLSRSRLYLSQNNYGLARTDAISARELLFGLLPSISSDNSNALRIVIERLDLALSNIETYPVVAVYDLDMAWRLLVDGLPNVPLTVLTPVISGTLMPTTIPQETTTPTP